jgi:glycosyltransferase involved in cell wall biosynthesis
VKTKNPITGKSIIHKKETPDTKVINGAVMAITGTRSSKMQRPTSRGKFLFVGKKKFWIRGVTYGTFRPNEAGDPLPEEGTIRRDFAQMVAHNINTVRLYTVPPVRLLDLAAEYGLRIMLGLPWEQHITFLDNKKVVQKIKDQVRQRVRTCAGHPAVLCYAIGNEIPSGIARWYGSRRVEQFLRELYDTVKAEDPESLVTYVNYPPTEYLQLPFLDLFCFNVYLETQETLNAYLARLQNLAGDRPLIMAEIGLDSRRNGLNKQSEILDWQIRTAFKRGVAGVFIFSWTDEWHRGGFDILDWDFGITNRDREPKVALKHVGRAFGDDVLSTRETWPFISVAVCTFNGDATLRECLDSLFQLNYPNYEVIVVNDGSSDDTEAIARCYDCRVITTLNRGLSNARNTAWQAAKGEFVAYIDDDAYADPDWLSYLAFTFLETEYAAVGGPNLPPPGDGFVATCVANAPGGPTHVLLSDQEAEHIPGCNMAFRKEALEKIGGFDSRYRTAGDDVDICWQIQERGWKIGFNPAAVVWHHHRNAISTYWKQQKGYGKAEALLETKWPQKFNFAGHLSWGGRLYAPGVIQPLLYPRWKIRYGIWGTGFFQSLYERDPHRALWFPLLPEWYVLVAILMGIAILGFIWSPLLWVFPLAGLTLAVVLLQAIRSTLMVHFRKEDRIRPGEKLKLKLLTGYLFLVQPLARLFGRLEYGLTLWRRRHKGAWPWPRRTYFQIWSEHWKSPEDWLTRLESLLFESGVRVKRGGAYDPWDLELREGLSMPTRILMVIEEHGSGKQLIRFRIWPRYDLINVIPVAFFLVLSMLALIDHAWPAAILMVVITSILIYHLFRHNLPLILACMRELDEIREKSQQHIEK